MAGRATEAANVPEAAKPATSRGVRDLLAPVLIALVIVVPAAWYFTSSGARTELAPAGQAAVGGVLTVMDETFDVSAGTYKQFTFDLRRQATVTVRLAVQDGTAVDLYAMVPADARESQRAHQDPSGVAFQYNTALSRQAAREFTSSAVLPPGTYSFMVRSTTPPTRAGNESVSRVSLKITAQGAPAAG